jgi:CheY-like chemotaxis protein
MHVVIVDDDDDVREIARLSMELIGGWTVSEASCAADAVALAADEQPDVVLLDMMMPGADGLETCRQLRDHESTRSIPVIFLTAKGASSIQDRLEPLGVCGVIAKPFDPMQLANQVADLLAKHTG